MNRKSNLKSGILIVDDHPVVVLALSKIIDEQHDLYCCGEAGDVANARKAFDSCMPDLVLIDLSLPDGDGLELVKEFSVARPYIPILVISQYDETIYADKALQAGARGYMRKGQVSAEIIAAIRAILYGETFVGALRQKIEKRVDGERPV